MMCCFMPKNISSQKNKKKKVEKHEEGRKTYKIIKSNNILERVRMLNHAWLVYNLKCCFFFAFNVYLINPLRYNNVKLT